MSADANLPDRVLRLETGFAAVRDDVADMRRGQDALCLKIDKVVDAVTSTDGRSAERAQAVKIEVRDEADRKARDRGELFKNCLALMGAVALVVGALGGPYVAKLEATSTAQRETTSAVAGVRELIAADHAEIVRNRDSLDISRDRNRAQDERLAEVGERLAGLEAKRR